MKAKYTGKIKSVSKDGGDTTLLLECSGKVDTKNINAQVSTMEIAVKFRSLVADEIKLGTQLTIHLSDEEVE
jgi:hypothetical protein